MQTLYAYNMHNILVDLDKAVKAINGSQPNIALMYIKFVKSSLLSHCLVDVAVEELSTPTPIEEPELCVMAS
jgi:hypothetical protein